MKKKTRFLIALLLSAAGLQGCEGDDSGDGLRVPGLPGWAGCELTESGFGPESQAPMQAEKWITGLDVPWAIAFLPDGDLLVTERPGRVRLVEGNALISDPVLAVSVGEQGEGGMMGIAVDPAFSSNRAFYVYYTAIQDGQTANRLERYILSEDHRSATLDRALLENIPAGTFHNGGRLRVGPDGALYLGTGDARVPELSQNPASLAGKILRINPSSGSHEIFMTGIRNTQGFDWWDESTLVVSDHGPSGELGLTGRDEVSLARRGDNLGWPRVTGCESGEGFVLPAFAWSEALPPGGLAVRDESIFITALGARHLHQIRPDGTHEVHFAGDSGFGRLREVVAAPDGALLVTTSNCDGRGACPSEGDVILRIR